MRVKIYSLFLISFFCSLQAIGQENGLTQSGKLISEKFIGSIAAAEINNHLPEAKELQGDISKLPKYDIDLYSIVYTSTFNDKKVELSGLIIVPKSSGKLDHLQYHHGTMLPYPQPKGEGSLDAPSLYDCKPTEYKAQYETRLFGNYLASHGYLVSMPDYVGYGESSHLEHPYSVNNILAQQSVDMILATKEFCQKKGINLSEKLYLSGWSEGGAACVAAQKLIESKYKNKLRVTANAPLAGFYNTTFYLNKSVKMLPKVNDDLGETLDVQIWLLYAINTYTKEIPKPMDIFTYPVKNQLDVLKNRPSSIPSKIYKAISDAEIKKLAAKIEKHALSNNWSPIAPIYFHHGTKDDIVYYDNNVEVAIKNLNKNGGKCTLRKYKDHDHYTLAHLYLLSMVNDFSKH